MERSLKNIDSGVVYGWTALLATRPNMVECDVNGNIMESADDVEADGAEIDGKTFTSTVHGVKGTDTIMRPGTRYMKHRENGSIHIWTPILDRNPNMIECTQVGKVIDTFKPREFVRGDGEKVVITPEKDVSSMTLAHKTRRVKSVESMIDIGARYGIGFAEGMKLPAMKKAFLEQLPKVTNPIDPEVERS